MDHHFSFHNNFLYYKIVTFYYLNDSFFLNDCEIYDFHSLKF